jgi:DNA modification methylase
VLPVSKMRASKPVRGFLFACTEKTERECFERLLFGSDKVYAPVVTRVRKGDLLFLNNLDTDTLYGVFRAVSDGDFNMQPSAWNGKYPYQVKVEIIGEKKALKDAKKSLNKLEIRRNTPIVGEKLITLLDALEPNSALLNPELWSIEKMIEKKINEVDIEEEIPNIEATTLWNFPRQSYGLTPKGDNRYPGVTPALIIYNLIWRYTQINDLIVDPMCGSGTTIDVCKEEKRDCVGLDISPPSRHDEVQSDARYIPLRDSCADMVFIDSPYGDNIRYNEHSACIGKISSETEKFYDELEKVMIEAKRIMKEGKVLGWLIGDQWVKNMFTPVGLNVYNRLCKHFEPIDIICITRRGQSSHTGVWFNRARRFNFFLRGFKYLLIMRKTQKTQAPPEKHRKINWDYYERG